MDDVGLMGRVAIIGGVRNVRIVGRVVSGKRVMEGWRYLTTVDDE